MKQHQKTKKNTNFKQNRIKNKFVDKVIDYFPRGGFYNDEAEGEGDVTFNKAPVIEQKKRKARELSQNKKPTKLTKRKAQVSVQLSDEDEQSNNKKTNKKQSGGHNLLERVEGLLLTKSQDFSQFFQNSKLTLDTIDKVQPFNYEPGSIILGAVCDIHSSGKYITLSLPRNKKGFVQAQDISDKEKYFQIRNNYEIGEYVIGKVLSAQQGHVQLTTRVLDINSRLKYEDIHPNQILVGIVESIEDHGIILNFYGEDTFEGFIRLQEQEEPISTQFIENKPIIVVVESKDDNLKMIYAKPLDTEIETKPLLRKDIVSGDNGSNTNLMHIVKPGNKFRVKVKKILENGLLVGFFKFYYGFIFIDHLNKNLEDYQVNESFETRVIAIDINQHLIHLSEKSHILQMSRISEKQLNINIGEEFNKCIVKQNLYGGAYLVSGLKISQKTGKKIRKTLFLHKLQIDINYINELEIQQHKALKTQAQNHGADSVDHNDLPNDSLNTLDDITEGYKFKMPLKIKEINFLDGFALATNKKEFLQKKTLLWSDINVGDIINGTLSRIIPTPNGSAKFAISINKLVTGLVDEHNLSDTHVSAQMLKKYKEAKKLKLRVLSIDKIQKQLRLTMKPIFLNQDTPILQNYDEIELNTYYYGYIVAETKTGFLVKFFNNITGILPFKNIEEIHQLSRSTFKIGQTIKVAINKYEESNKYMSLSLSVPENPNNEQTNEQYKTAYEIFRDQFNESFKLSKINNDEVASKVQVGQVYEYSVLKKSSSLEEQGFILKASRLLFSPSSSESYEVEEKEVKSKHKAVLYKGQLTDDIIQADNLYKTIKNQPDLKLIGKVLEVDESNTVWVTLKQSLVYGETPQSFDDIQTHKCYFGWVSEVNDKGLKINLSNTIRGFCSIKNIIKPENIQQTYPIDTTVKICVKTIKKEGKKLYMSMLEDDLKNKQNIIPIDIYNKTTLTHKYIQSHYDQNLAQQLHLENILHTDIIQQKWQSIRVGDLINVKVKLVKDYGIICTLNNQSNGLLLNSSLGNLNKQTIKKGDSIKARVCDIDYDKEIVDLYIDNEPEDNILISINKIFKNQKHLLQSGEIILVKKHYVIARCVKQKSLLVYIQVGNYQENIISSEKFQIGSKINTRIYNYELIKTQTVNQTNKLLYIPIGFISTNQTELNNNNTKSTVNKGNLKPGAALEVTVTKIVKNNVFVDITNNLFGRIHKLQFDYDEDLNLSKFDQVKVKDMLKVKVLNFSQHKKFGVELTALSKHISQADGELEKSIILPDTPQNFMINKSYIGCIKGISNESTKALYVELSNSLYGYCSAFYGIFEPEECIRLNTLSDEYTLGQIVRVKVQKISKKKNEEKEYTNIELSLEGSTGLEPQSFNVGDTVITKITKIGNRNIIVKLTQEIQGNVDITEIHDSWLPNPLKYYKDNQYVPGRVISIEENGKINVSLRESIVNPIQWQAISGSTIQYKKAQGHREADGDLRTRLYKLGNESLKSDMIFIGYINDTNDKGCFIKIGRNCVVRARLNEVSDNPQVNPQLEYPRNKLVIGRILTVRQDGKVDASLKESVVLHGLFIDSNNIKQGSTVYGIVSEFVGDGAKIYIQGSPFYGLLNAENYHEEDIEGNQELRNYLEIGTKLKLKILKIDKEKLPIKIKVGTKQVYFPEDDEENLIQNPQYSVEQVQHIQQLIDSVKEINHEAVLALQNTNGQLDLTKLQQAIDDNEMELEGQLNEQDEEIEEGDEQDDEEEDDEENNEEQQIDQDNEQNINDDENIEEDNDENDILSEAEDDNNIQHIDIDDEYFIQTSNKNLKKKKSEFEKFKKEEQIRKQEEQMLNDKGAQLNTEDSYEKLILNNPNSSYIWISFAAFNMEKSGIDKARKTVERALKTINFRNENEKLNLWTAYLNLEFNFGTEQTLMRIFERALQANNPKQVYYKMIDIYKRANKYDMVEDLCKVMTKKFKNSARVWINHFKCLLEKKKLNSNVEVQDQIKILMKRALQSLPKRKHIKILSHYAILEYKFENTEKGRTTFEAILSSYPKRTDIWSVYLDLEIKYGTPETIRNLFERAITLNLKLSKMKFFFKRYLTYEQEHGTSETVENVKEKAQQFVEAKLKEKQNKIEEESDEEAE